MPIYEYLCPKCRKIFEEWTKSAGDAAPASCPHCATPAPKVMSQTSFVLKGDGWYVSDYGYRKGVKEDGKDAPKTDDKTVGQDAAVQDAAAQASKISSDDSSKPPAVDPVANKGAEKPKTTPPAKHASQRKAGVSAP